MPRYGASIRRAPSIEIILALRYLESGPNTHTTYCNFRTKAVLVLELTKRARLNESSGQASKHFRVGPYICFKALI